MRREYEPLRPHLALIARVRAVCEADPALDAALMYGSFAQGTADQYSDIEFWLFFTTAPASPTVWITQVHPPLHVIKNESGAHVAFFPGLIRGEFHFAPVTQIESVAAWPAAPSVPLVDRHNRLPHPAATIDHDADICGRFANWLLLAHHVGQRGEHLRQRDALSHANRHLLWMARRCVNATEHWQTPSRMAEHELPAELVAGFARTDENVQAAWQLGRSLWLKLDPNPPWPFIDELDKTIGAVA